jgi:hypothetical protein
MPTPATDRQRATLVVFAVLSVALAALALRVVNGAAAPVNKPIPAADLQSVTAYLGPLAGSASLAAVGGGIMVGERDPFGSTTPAVSPPARSAGMPVSGPTTGGGQQWVVSSILFEASRRSAIVNNAWVGVGDPLGGGARVTAIERKYVIVTDANGNRHVVPIQGGAL